MINRNKYLNELISKINNGMIKVITGPRRVGKSFLLSNIFIPYLMQKKIDEKHIIYIALDQNKNKKMRNIDNLSDYITNQLKDQATYYLFIDEIQLVEDFEDLLNELKQDYNIDIYITGSNSQMLSTDIATRFRGRGDIIHIYPLVFSEFYQVSKSDKKEAFIEYLKFGGMPQLITINDELQKINYLKNLFDATYIKDIVDRYKIKKINLLNSIIDFLSSNIGSLTNIVKIENTLKSKGFKNITDDTIAKYINYLINSFIINCVERYDIKGKEYFSRLNKYYFSDVGLRNARLNFRQTELTHLLENVIYLELLYRGFIVDVGAVKKRVDSKDIYKEIDFIAKKGMKQYYIQVVYSLNTENKLNSEIESFKLVGDGFKKILLTFESSPFQITEEGYIRIDILDFLFDNDIFDKF